QLGRDGVGELGAARDEGRERAGVALVRDELGLEPLGAEVAAPHRSKRGSGAGAAVAERDADLFHGVPQVTLKPVSTLMVWPLIHCAASEARNSVGPTSASAGSSLPSGMRFRMPATRSRSFRTSSLNGVSAKPGDSELAVMPC